MPQESRPSTSGDDPPPPGAAQGLVARAGFVVYEGGRSVFDESVLVYIAHHQRSWPNAEVVDHVGRPLGAVRRRQNHGLLRTTPLFRITDPAGGKLFDVVAKNRLLSRRYVVTGVAAVDVLVPGTNHHRGRGTRRLDRWQAHRRPRPAVHRARQRQQGRGGHTALPQGQQVGPRLRLRDVDRSRSAGEFRRASVAAPVALEQARHAEQSAS